MPTLSYNIAFSLDSALASGSISMTQTTAWGVPSDIEIAWGFYSPDGTPCFLPTQGATWSIHPDISDTGTLPLPTDVTGKVMTGNYRILATVYDANGPTVTVVAEQTIELCADIPDLCVEPAVNCYTGIVTITDATKWAEAGWTVVFGTMTLRWPSDIYHAPISGTGPVLTTGGEPIWTGPWTGTSHVTATKGSTTISLTTLRPFTVHCDMDGCTLYCMMKGVYADYVAAAGTDLQEAAKQKLKLQELGMIYTMIEAAVGCADGTYLDALSARFKQVATGGKPCSCCDDCGGSRPVVPVSGGSGATYTAGTGITITGTVISVSQAIRDLLAALYNTDVDSPGGSLVVTETTTVGSPDLVTKHLAVKVPAPHTIAWTETWTTLGANRVVGAYYLNPPADNVFQEPTIRQAVPAPFNNQWLYADFFSGFPVAYTVEIDIYDIAPAAGMGVNLTAGSVIRAEWERDVADFIVSLVQTSDVLGGVTGAKQTLGSALWISLIDSFTMEIKLTQVL